MAKEQLPVAELTIWDDAQKMLVKAREEGIKTAWDRYAAQSPHLEVVKAGKIRGFCAIVGCNNPRMQHDFANVGLAKALIERDILVLVTGCVITAVGKAGLLMPEGKEMAGPGLQP